MTVYSNPYINNVMAAFSGQASKSVMQAIKGASSRSGVDFAYLMQQASAESSFDPSAKAKTSSATGLYQFIERTWLDMVDRHGEKYGVPDNLNRDDILALRKDPELAANMAAELARENRDVLEANWGGDIGSTELYFAHFMGAGGASAFLNARDQNPLQAAADLFPEAAKANRAVFYEPGTQRARTLDEVYAFFDRKFTIEVPESPVFKDSAKPRQNTGPGQITPVSDMRSQLFTNQGASSEALYSSRGGFFQTMLVNPVELMLLTQLDTPLDSESAGPRGRFLYSS